MSPWPRLRFPWLHCTLVALTIQGISPDPRDLASGSITTILNSLLSLSERMPAAADEPPSGDDTTGNVCAPAAAATERAGPGRGAFRDRRRRPAITATTMDRNRPRLGSLPSPPPTDRRLATLGGFRC